MDKQELEEDLSQQLSKLAINKAPSVSVKRSLIGSYSWEDQKRISIPGYPSVLRNNFMTVPANGLEHEKPSPKEVHPNQYFHDIYFEPVEEVLKWAQRELHSFDILTDRNNMRKIDAALSKDMENYQEFSMLLRKHGDLLVIKREEDESQIKGTTIGKQYEKKLCHDSPFWSCHVIVEVTVTLDGKKSSLLLRGEVDCVTPGTSIPSYKLERTTSEGLIVSLGSQPLHLKDIRELKMARTLKDTALFQSWMLGVPYIIHGVHKRFQTKVEDNLQYAHRLGKAVQYLLECREKMDDTSTYMISRSNAGSLRFEKTHDERKWLAANDSNG